MPDIERSTAEIQRRLLGVGGFLRIMSGHVRPYWRYGLMILGGLLLEMAFLGSVPIGFKFLIDEALPSVGKPLADKTLLVWILVALTAGSVVVAGAGLMRDWFYARLATYVMNDLRRGMLAHLQRLGMDYYARAHVGDIITRFSGDLASVEYALHAAIPLGILPALEVAFSTALLFWLDWRMALVAMAVWPLALAGPRFFPPPRVGLQLPPQAGRVRRRRDHPGSGRRASRDPCLWRTATISARSRCWRTSRAPRPSARETPACSSPCSGSRSCAC